jgi:chloramphenicol 3-O-phosphotransferase
MKTHLVALFGVLVWLKAHAAQGDIVLFNGTSSAGKSSLAEAMVSESSTKFEVMSRDGYWPPYEEKLRAAQLQGKKLDDPYPLALYRYAKEQSQLGKNVILDTVEFDQDYDKFCAVLDCAKVTKVIIYCPLQSLLKRIEKRNNAGVAAYRRPVLSPFRQFLEMYQLQSSTKELVVDKTTTITMRSALVEAGKKAENSKEYEALYQEYVKAFRIDTDQPVIIVAKRKYDLVLNTRTNTKKENVRLLEVYMLTRRG